MVGRCVLCRITSSRCNPGAAEPPPSVAIACRILACSRLPASAFQSSSEKATSRHSLQTVAQRHRCAASKFTKIKEHRSGEHTASSMLQPERGRGGEGGCECACASACACAQHAPVKKCRWCVTALGREKLRSKLSKVTSAFLSVSTMEDVILHGEDAGSARGARGALRTVTAHVQRQAKRSLLSSRQKHFGKEAADDGARDETSAILHARVGAV